MAAGSIQQGLLREQSIGYKTSFTAKTQELLKQNIKYRLYKIKKVQMQQRMYNIFSVSGEIKNRTQKYQSIELTMAGERTS